MPPATTEQLQALEPYIAGAAEDERGEVEMFCPLHPDRKRSASLNAQKGVWYCHAGCGGGSVRQLVFNEDAFIPLDGRGVIDLPTRAASPPPASMQRPTLEQVQHWHRRLRRAPDMLGWLEEHRGIQLDTVRKALLGYDGKVLKIPVFSPRRRIWNVRNYDPHPRGDRSKAWNTRGLGKARLYPVGPLTRASYGDAVLVCEGEFDTLLALQLGFLAVTRTDGAGKPWQDRWTDHFAGLRVYACHDCDRAGHEGDMVVLDALKEVAQVYRCNLPFEYREQGGQDLTDYLRQYEWSAVALAQLMEDATPMEEAL